MNENKQIGNDLSDDSIHVPVHTFAATLKPLL